MTALISFLGKGQDGRGYRETNYCFEDGQVYQSQKYFGLALAEKINPEKIILLGTEVCGTCFWSRVVMAWKNNGYD